MSILRSFYRSLEKIRKPSLEANLESIRQVRAKRLGASGSEGEAATRAADTTGGAVQPDEPIEDVLRRDWELVSTFSAPSSPHVSEEELQTLLAGDDLPTKRQEHYDECLLCQDLLSRSVPTPVQVAQFARRLATPPAPVRPAAAPAMDDVELEDEIIPAGQVTPADNWSYTRRERALAPLCGLAAVLLVGGVYHEEVSERIAMLREGPSLIAQAQSLLAQARTERDANLLAAVQAQELARKLQGRLDESKAALAAKGTTFEQIAGLKPKFIFSSTAPMASYIGPGAIPDFDPTKFFVANDPVYSVGHHSWPIIFSIDPKTAGQPAHGLNQWPFQATITGNATFNANQELEFQIDWLKLNPPAAAAEASPAATPNP